MGTIRNYVWVFLNEICYDTFDANDKFWHKKNVKYFDATLSNDKPQAFRSLTSKRDHFYRNRLT